MNKKMIIALFITLTIILITLIIVLWPPKFELSKNNITLEYGQKYKEPGYKVTKFGHNYTKKVKVTNKVNYKKIGTYDVIYSVKIGLITYKDIRKVTIADKEKPKITLKGFEEVNVCPNTNYVEEGYEAKDNYDGDLTKKVKVKKKDDKITYTVTDSSKNKAKVTRNITKKDNQGPTITINGNQNEIIYLKNNYKDKGATANDNCDGDLTDKIQKEGSVNTNKEGTYTITYSVTDNNGNESKISRNIKVIKPSETGANAPGTIYLTFDDGPNPKTTAEILDILKEENVKATFFVTNSGPDSLIKREFDEGHTVGLHTASHNYATIYSSVDNYYNDLNQVKQRVKNITGDDPKFIRFPGGSSNTVSRKYSEGIMTYLTNDVVNKGYKYFDWNISSGDAGETTNPDGVYNNVVKNLSKNHSNMILMHDIKPYTKDALRNIIKYGKENGYTFQKITDETNMVKQHVNN